MRKTTRNPERMNSIVETALELLSLGAVPIPIKANSKKPPLIQWKRYQKEHPTKEKVRQWFQDDYPDANLAVLTGAISGFDVIDFDAGHDPWPLKDCPLPTEFIVTTPNNGQHVYVKHVEGVKNSASRLATGIDIRGDGGYILFPPSKIQDKSYIVQSGSLQQVLKTDTPPCLQNALKLHDRKKKKSNSLPEIIQKGTRNSTLLRYGGSLRNQGMTEPEILEFLAIVNQERCNPPLPAEEILNMSKFLGTKEPEQTLRNDPKSFFNEKTFQPLRLARALMDNNSYCYGFDEDRGTGLLMTYKNGTWRPAIGVEIEAQQLLGECTRGNHIRETVGTLNRDCPRRPWQSWNSERLHINCTNGMLDPTTLELKKHSPDYFSTFQIPVAWNPEIAINRVDSFLHELLSPEEVQTVLEIVGYLATCDVSAKSIFIFEGEGNTGKTELLTLIQNFIGMRNIAICSLQDLAENRFALANLENKQLVVFDDIGDKGLANTSVLKVLTGRFSTIRVERKGIDAYNAPLYARLLFTTNEMPVSYSDHSGAWYNRLLIIPFKNEFTGNRIDKNLTTTLAEQKCLERLFVLGAHALCNLAKRKMCFSPTTSMTEARREYRRRADSVAAFVDEECFLSPEAYISKTALFHYYDSWCDKTKSKSVGRNTAYKRLLSLEGITEGKRAGAERIFVGIGLKSRQDGEGLS